VTQAQSDAVALSWDDPEVRASRLKKDAVMLDGNYYPSTWQAWKATAYHQEVCQELSESTSSSRCIRFRKRLKVAGELWENGHHWKIVPLTEA
jgi:hypothetical protein